ncbi:type VI secretion system tip protein TssI/VgrG [Sorangium sp. So ce429]
MAGGKGVMLGVRSDALNEEVKILRAHGHEAMNALSAWEVDVLTGTALAGDALVGAAASLLLQDLDKGSSRVIPLLVTEVAFVGETADGLAYALRLAPPEWPLTQRLGYHIFRDKTGPDIVRQLLGNAGTEEHRMAFRLGGSYGVRPHSVQYGETDWAFLERICAEEGFSYWFDSAGAEPLLVFGDDPASHDGLEGGTAVPFEDPSNTVRPRAFFELEVAEEITAEAVALRDHDVRRPDVPIEGVAGAGPFEYYEYPSRTFDSVLANERARVRLEQLRRLRVRAAGRSDTPRLQPGRVVTITGTAQGEMDGDYVVVSVEHRWSQAARNAGVESGYHNEAVLVPRTGQPYRPALPAERPVVDGVETAIVAGPSGEEIHVNDLAELKIRFPWDRSGIADHRASTWVRTLQMGLGGALCIPRVGWEVPVAYYDGDPDRPLVLGRLYNAENALPYGMPGAKATSALQSATSPGGGATNELRLGDDAGKMEMFLHASRDQSVSVGGSATTEVSVDAAHDVGQSLTVSITSDQTLTVGADQTVDVVMDDSLGVEGARAETVGGVESVKVTANRIVAVKGGYSELVGALYGVQANQANVAVTGVFGQMIGATLAHAAGIGTSESVGGARVESVGGVRSVNAAREYGESVTGAKTVTAGACRMKAGTVVTTTTMGAQTTQAGGAVEVQAGGVAVFGANQIEIQAASLDVGAMALAGGAFKVRKGAAKLEGKIKRRGGTNIR